LIAGVRRDPAPEQVVRRRSRVHVEERGDGGEIRRTRLVDLLELRLDARPELRELVETLGEVVLGDLEQPLMLLEGLLCRVGPLVLRLLEGLQPLRTLGLRERLGALALDELPERGRRPVEARA